LPSAEQRVTLPQPLEYVVNHCIAPLPADRFATVEDVLNAFEYAYQYLNASSPQKMSSSTPVSIPVQGKDSTASEANSIQPIRNFQQVRTPRHSDGSPQQLNGFYQEDYASTTVNFDISNVKDRQYVPSSLAPGKPPRAQKSRRNPIFAIVTLLVVFLLLAAASLFFYTEIQPTLVVKANVNFGPQVRLVKQVFHIKGSVTQQNIDVNTATIPVKTISGSKNGSLSGQTSGQKCIILPLVGCQLVVS